MNEWAKVVLAVAVLLFAAFILAGAFGLLAGIEVSPLWGENEGQVLPDFDGDGMPDAWENQHGLNPNDSGDANQDPDGDGYTNYEEYVAGTDPNNPFSCPVAEVPVDGVPPHTPVFEIIGAPRTWFLRGSVGEVYEGGAWRMIENSEAVEYGGEDLVPAVEEFSSSIDWRTTIVPTAPMGRFVPVPGYAIRVENLENLKYFPLQQSFLTGSSFDNPYSVSYRIFEYDEYLLRGAELDLGPAYLQLPTEVTGRTRQLALEVTQGLENPYEKAKTIENYLRTNYTYDLNYTRAPVGWDPIDWFLFEERRGHCVNFNSAFVILARCADIPARTVFGFAVDSDVEYQVVYADDSHCNAEVKFKDLGWVPFNATAPRPCGICDSDGDGMPDCWEERYGLDPHDPGDACTDCDGDGSTNFQEYRAGTDPMDPRSCPGADLIPTKTEITGLDETVLKGGTFEVAGRVTDEGDGTGVDNLMVIVYLMERKAENEDAPEYGYGSTVDGEFDITCEVPEDIEVGDYYVIVRALGNEKYAGSWSDPKIKIVSETALHLSVPERSLIGMEFLIRGGLVEKTTGNGVGSQAITARCGSSFQKNLVTGEDGSFQVTITLPAPDNYSVSASFDGSGYYLASSCESAVEVLPPDIAPTTGENLIRGEKAKMSGTVPIEDLTVQISFDNELVARLVSGTGGVFEAEHLIPSSMSPGAATIVYTLPDFSFSKLQDVFVYAKTSIEYDAPSEVGPGENIKIIGRIHDDPGAPLPGAWLTLEYADRSAQAKTDNAGAATFEVEIPPESGEELEFALSFEGSGFHLPSEKAGSVTLAPAPPARGLTPIAITAAAGAAVSVTVAAIIRRRKRKACEKAKPAEVEKAPRKLASRKGLRLEITFPQIKEPFPDVWGVDDPLQVSVCLARGGKPIDGASLRVGIDGGEKEVRASASGAWKANHKFGKGTHRATAKYTEGKLKLKAEGDVRIVDYREEIVGVFNSVLESLRGIGIDPGGDLTPREIQNEAREKIKGVDAGALDELVKIFEVANYSLHEIGRKEYERVYLSSQSVTRSMGGQA